MIWSEQRRVKVDGFHHSDLHLTIAVLVLNTGQVQMVVEGVEPTMQSLVHIRQILDEMVKEIDRKLPHLVNEHVREVNRG